MRPPIQWGVFPRMKVWTVQEMNKAKNEDRVEEGDFGLLGCADVTYGERNAMTARDIMPQKRTRSKEIVDQVVNAMKAAFVEAEEEGEDVDVDDLVNVIGRGKRRRGATTSLNAYQYRKLKIHSKAQGSGSNMQPEIEQQPQQQQDSQPREQKP